MKKLFLLLLLTITLTLSSCGGLSLPPFKMPYISELSSVTVFGKGFISSRYYQLETNETTEEYNTYPLNITDEEWDLLQVIDVFNKNDILNLGLLTPSQKIQMKSFVNKTNRSLFSITLGFNHLGEDTIVIRCLENISNWRRSSFNLNQTICFPLETISNETIISKAKEASNLDEITQENLTSQELGIYIFDYEKLPNKTTKITFFYLSLEGNLFWFDISV